MPTFLTLSRVAHAIQTRLYTHTPLEQFIHYLHSLLGPANQPLFIRKPSSSPVAAKPAVDVMDIFNKVGYSCLIVFQYVALDLFSSCDDISV